MCSKHSWTKMISLASQKALPRISYLEAKLVLPIGDDRLRPATTGGRTSGPWLASSAEPMIVTFHGVFPFEWLSKCQYDPNYVKWWAVIKERPSGKKGAARCFKIHASTA